MVPSVPRHVFADRAHAGRLLADELRSRGELPSGALVLAIPRGGVLVAAEVARAAPGALDVALARKVGAPGNPELAVGAVGPDGSAVLDAAAQRLVPDDAWLARAMARAREELDARLRRFRGDRPPVAVGDRAVIVVDDGVATGSTAAAVGTWLRQGRARRAVLAVPVAPRRTLDELGRLYDTAVALATPEPFYAVGEFYRDFRQVTDEEVVAALSNFPDHDA
jgi:predicted phosphoribosyltransferase